MRGFPARLGESGCKSPAVPVTVIPLGSGCSRRRSDDVPEPLRLSRIASHLARCRGVCRRCAWGSGGKGTPMGELERNMRDDVGQPQGNAPSTDNGGQLDMFEDERERVSHRRGAIARGVAKRGLVAFLAFAMAFGTTPAQLWAEGAEGIAEAVAQAAPLAENGSGESATSPAADLNTSGMVANGGTAEQDATATASGPTDKTEDDSAAGNEAPAASTSDASKQDTAVVSAAGEAKAQPAKAESQEVSATCSVVGTDAKGAQQTWAAAQRITLKEGSTAADLSEQLFKQAGLTTDYDPNGTWGWALNTITSPFDKDRKLGYDSATGAYWQLFVNGSASEVGAGGYTLKDGDSVVWCYSKYGDPAPEQVSVTMEIIGKKAGMAQRWTSPSTQVFVKGTSIKDASATYFDALGIESKMYDQFGYWGVHSLVSPLDGTELSGAWSFFVNGVPGTQLDNDYVLKSGDKVVWAYAPGDTLPGVDNVVLNPSAARPNWDCDWSGFTSADKVTDAPVPTKDADEKWVSELKTRADGNKGVSDALLIGDYLYVAVGSKLLKKDVETGKTVLESPLAAAIDSTSRMVYTNGVVLVPLSGGRLQALTVDVLATVWVTDGLPAGPDGAQQSLASVSVRDGYAYFGTASADWIDSSDGYLLCVRISDGKVMWQHKNENSKGYYWAGMAFSGDYGVIADDSGTVSTVDPSTGKTVAKLKIADRVRANVLVDGATAYVVSADGTLHKIAIANDGALSELGKVTFGSSSTSTPVFVNGKIVVGGTSIESFMGGPQNSLTSHYGQLAIIDADTLTVDYTIYKAYGNFIREDSSASGFTGSGDVKSQPVVSIQDGHTYVYFTSNNNPGGIYRYRIGDEEAELLYRPSAENQQYCMSSISVGSDGSLYYANDSGKLFAIKGNGQKVNRYTVSFDANGADSIVLDSQRIKAGKTATEPAVKPRRKGYTFGGWYTDEACTQAYDFSTPVTADLTLYAKWTKNATNSGDNGGSGSSGGSGSGTGTGTGTGTGSGAGSGSKGPQAGGAIAPGQKPVTKTTVSTKTETKENKSDKKGSDKSDKKDEKKSEKKDSKSDKKSDSKSDTGAASTTTAKKSSGASEQETGTNPLAIVGIAAGVIGLALIAVFVLTKRGKGDGNAR